MVRRGGPGRGSKEQGGRGVTVLRTAKILGNGSGAPGPSSAGRVGSHGLSAGLAGAVIKAGGMLQIGRARAGRARAERARKSGAGPEIACALHLEGQNLPFGHKPSSLRGRDMWGRSHVYDRLGANPEITADSTERYEMPGLGPLAAGIAAGQSRRFRVRLAPRAARPADTVLNRKPSFSIRLDPGKQEE